MAVNADEQMPDRGADARGADAPAAGGAPEHADRRAPGRDRYLDLLRAVALARVVAFHTFNAAWLTLVFPSLGVMFALAGSLMARSLARPAAGVLRSRARRLLLPLWVYAATVLGLLFWAGWRPYQEEGSGWLSTLLWFVPIGDPPFPESIGSDSGLAESSWGVQAEEILWYVRAYFWFMLLSPLLLKAFRRLPWVTLLAPLALVAAINLGVAKPPSWAEGALTDFAVFGSCWILGFAHHDGLLRRLAWRTVLPAGAAAMALGLVWLVNNPADEPWDVGGVPLAQALWSLGFCVLLLRASPSWASLPRPLRFLDKPVTLVNNRAMTIYLWHNLLLVATVPLIDQLWEDPQLAEGVPWLLESEWLQLVAVALLLVAAILAVGWIEDVAARRPPRLWPTGSAVAGLPAAGRGATVLGATSTANRAGGWLRPDGSLPELEFRATSVQRAGQTSTLSGQLAVEGLPDPLQVEVTIEGPPASAGDAAGSTVRVRQSARTP
ncbi:acyltransferase family protein [Arthrobacter halodurans]|uniref:Acyltransferase n=1 Tax=Arthrobacter halodurans TaxID=516699 RepID=A0ABV4UNW8_9MICC